jgi:hypothetical protein
MFIPEVGGSGEVGKRRERERCRSNCISVAATTMGR